ncbi:MAG TPA: hypothetical protein DHW82_09675 [Spirochaetia bacterium]|nr:hypothetical protein [Spirochaetia bacterium]
MARTESKEKTVGLFVKLPQDTIRQIDELAKKELRPRASLIAYIVRDYAERMKTA